MTDTAQGPGWWQASDGRWYPPEPGGPPPGAPVPNAGKATATLVLGILAFFTCPILAIAALIVGAQADKQIRESYGRLGGEGLVKTGRILAIVNLVFAVLTIPIMAAIAIPTFLGARERAQDRAVQTDLRNALTAEKVIYTDEAQWTNDLSKLKVIEPALTYETGTQPAREGVIYVFVGGDAVELSARSESGSCFYVITDSSGAIGYAEDEACGDASGQDFRSTWS